VPLPAVSAPYFYRLALFPALALLYLFIWGGNQPEAAGLRGSTVKPGFSRISDGLSSVYAGSC